MCTDFIINVITTEDFDYVESKRPVIGAPLESGWAKVENEVFFCEEPGKQPMFLQDPLRGDMVFLGCWQCS